MSKALTTLRAACATGRDCQTVTVQSLAAWLNEEYSRMAAHPHHPGDTAHVKAGYMAALAEIECICKSGVLPRHCACREDWLQQQAKAARECDALLTHAHPVSAAGGEGERQ